MHRSRIAPPVAVVAMLAVSALIGPRAGAQPAPDGAMPAGSGTMPAAPPASAAATAPLLDESGASVGRVHFRESGRGTEVTVRVEGVAAGRHGVHIHVNGDCGPGTDAATGERVPFGAAGGHFDPGSTGNHDDPDQPYTVGHGGDLPNVEVGEDGTGSTAFTTEDLTVRGERTVLGRTVVLHAAPDDYATDPAGASGARIACGVIEADEQVPAIAARLALPASVTFPEGITAAGDGTFLVGSSADGSIARIDPAGEASLFAAAGAEGRTAALGMARDAAGRIHVAGGATGQVSVLRPDGSTERALRVDDAAASVFLNDVAVARDGWAYVTDSRQPVLYRYAVDPASSDAPAGAAGDAPGAAEVSTARLERWLDLTGTPITYGEGFNLNGVVVSESGSFLVAVQSNTGRLWRIDTADGAVEEIDTGGVTFSAGDGLVLADPPEGEPDDARPTLYVIQNATSTITRLDLDPAGRWAEVTGEVRSDGLRFPTTGALGDGSLFVVNGQLDQREGSPVLPFDVTATPLGAFDRTAAPSSPVDGGAAEDCSDELALPEGFCATTFADGLVGARQLAVGPDGTLYAAIAGARDGSTPGTVAALRDADGDGVAESVERFADRGGNGVEHHDGWLYVARNDSVVRYDLRDGAIPTSPPQTIVRDLPATPDHNAKTVVVTDDGRMLVNIGSASNACQVENRVPFSPGIDPCPELDERAGIWEFSATEPDQGPADGTRIATGVRNANALDIDPVTGQLYAAVNGRDQLYENWPDRFSPAQDRTTPAEELLRVERGADYGWPYCYFDAALGRRVLAPEYGGDGTEQGRCAGLPDPAVTFPAHWAPLSMLFPQGDQLGEEYREGAFVAFHGSRFDPVAQPAGPGYLVAWVPFSDGVPTGAWSVFADGFAGGATELPEQAAHRAVGLAQGADGALYVSDDKGGRIWRVTRDDS